jgi:hypothetical protein
MASAGSAGAPEGPPQDLKDYDPEDSGTLMEAVSDLQVRRVRELVTDAGQDLAYRSFPQMPDSGARLRTGTVRENSDQNGLGTLA